MAFLTVAGITVPIAPAGAVRKAPEIIGNDSRSFLGNLRTTVRVEKRGWQFTTKPLIESDAAAIEAAISGGAHVACNGSALNNIAVTCRVTAADGAYTQVRGGYRRALVLTLREV